MSKSDLTQITIMHPPDAAVSDVDELAQSLDAARLDAVIMPHPTRMGLADQLAPMIIEIPLTVLGSAILTTAGRRMWVAVRKVIRRSGVVAGTADGVVAVIRDSAAQIRFLLTLDDLADDRLLAELARIGKVRKASRPVDIVWDSGSGRFLMRLSTETATTDRAGSETRTTEALKGVVVHPPEQVGPDRIDAAARASVTDERPVIRFDKRAGR